MLISMNIDGEPENGIIPGTVYHTVPASLEATTLSVGRCLNLPQ